MSMPLRTPINANGVILSDQTLGIIYAVIARGASVILAHHAACHGNFTEVAQQVLGNIPPESDGRLTYAAGDYMYHYVCEDDIVYMCITDDDFERSKAFLFLEEIKTRFQKAYGDSVHTAVPYAMNSEFSGQLAREMQVYTNTALSLLSAHNPLHLENIGIRDLEISDGTDLEQLELQSDNESMRSYETLLSYKDLIFKQRKCFHCCQENWKRIVIFLVIFTLIAVITIAVVFGICLNENQNRCGIR